MPLVPFVGWGARPGGSLLFQLPDAVAEFRRLLVRLAADRLLELFAQLDQFRLGLLRLRQAAGRLPHVAGLAVDVLQEREQLVAELLVVVRAAEPARVAELDELDPADRALPLLE